MSLQPLQWRKLPVRTATTGSVSDVLNMIYDMLTGSLYHDGSARVIGSGSAWRMPTKFATGSNTEAVYLYPGFQTAISQSVIFSGRSSTGASSSATPSVVTNENAYSSSILHVAVVKNASGSFTQWTSQNPFGSGSFSSGYTRVLKTNLSAGEKITILESKEAIAIFETTATSTVRGAVAGAIIDPEQTASYAAESDGRLYGIATSGTESAGTVQALSTAFFETNNVAGAIFSHSTSAQTTNIGYPRFITFAPGTNSLNTNSFDAVNELNSNVYLTGFTTLSGRLVKIPMRCYNKSTNYFTGRIRDIYMIRAFPSNLIVRDSLNNISGFTISNSESSAAASTVLFNYT